MKPSYRPTHTLHAHSSGITALRYSPTGLLLASASADSTIHLWSTPPHSAPSHLRSLRGHHTRGINDLAWSKDGLYLASASDDGLAIIWSSRTGKPLRILRGHTSHVLCVAFNPKSNILATGGWDESVILWNVQRGTRVKTLQAHSDPVSCLGFNGDGTMLVTGSHDGLMRLWDATTGQCLKTIEDDQNSPISHAQFTPNNQYLLSSSLSSTIRLWDFKAASPKVIKTFTGHRAGRWGCGVVVVDGRRRESESKLEKDEREQVGEEEKQEDEDGREVKRRKVSPNPETTPGKSVSEENVTNPPSNQPADHFPTSEPTNPQIPRALSAPSRTPQTTTPEESDTAYIVTGTDTPSAILYDLQSRTILQRLNPRTYSNPSSQSDPITAEHVTPGLAAPELAAPELGAEETGAAAQAAHEKEAAAAGDEDEACLAIGAHPSRRELAIGGLGDGGVVRIWKDFS